ncbi:response regulator transcription factor [Sulfurospirillum cavolei]|uniref:response regulator transcription factor n=1 Tax=Sulfurospirillum cavolei TaxID=366522 RepID=UPI0005A9FAC5|nr:response regulator transcription factor [Sulfurospirillum cavolei]
MKLLIVEDDPKIVSFLKKGLEEEYFCVDTCDNGEDAIYLAQSTNYDLIVLDIMLKGLGGDSVCQTLRAQKNAVPIIMLSAKSTINDKVTLLNSGADDYLTKPFSFEELLARIYAQLRKHEHKDLSLRAGDLELNPLNKTVERAGKSILLTAKEFAILEYLLRRKGTIVEEKTLQEHLFNNDQTVNSNIVSVYMYRLRTKIDKPFDEKLITTYRNLGYSIHD